MSIKEKLPIFFNKDDSTLLDIILSAIEQAIIETKVTTEKAVDSMILQNSVGEFLDYWGDWYGINRYPGESDLDYAIRILAEIKLPKQTIPAIKSYLSAILSVPEYQINIYEPYQDLFFLSGGSNLSGFDKLSDSEYWNWTVIDIQAPVQYSDFLRKALNRLKAGGIKVFWTHLLPPEPIIIDLSYVLSVESIITHFTEIYLDFFSGFELDNFGNLSETTTLSNRNIVVTTITLQTQQPITLPILSMNTLCCNHLLEGFGIQPYGSSWYGGMICYGLSPTKGYGTLGFGTTPYGSYTPL